MARISGIDLPLNKRVEIGLTYLYGIGPTRAQKILAETKVKPDIRIKDLSEADVQAIREFLWSQGSPRRRQRLQECIGVSGVGFGNQSVPCCVVGCTHPGSTSSQRSAFDMAFTAARIARSPVPRWRNW